MGFIQPLLPGALGSSSCCLLASWSSQPSVSAWSNALAGKREAIHCSSTTSPVSTHQTRDSSNAHTLCATPEELLCSISLAIHVKKPCLQPSELGGHTQLCCFWDHPAAHWVLQRADPSTVLTSPWTRETQWRAEEGLQNLAKTLKQ